jgi:hypothetical protein
MGRTPRGASIYLSIPFKRESEIGQKPTSNPKSEISN